MNYFSNGIYPNIYLRDQDVILVKPYEIETELVSGFKQLALFEMKKDEVVSDLINLSGGASSNTYKSKLFIERFDDFSQKIVEIDEINFKNAKLNDGDKISFKEINNENISGAVKGAIGTSSDAQSRDFDLNVGGNFGTTVGGDHYITSVGEMSLQSVSKNVRITALSNIGLLSPWE